MSAMMDAVERMGCRSGHTMYVHCAFTTFDTGTHTADVSHELTMMAATTTDTAIAAFVF